MSDQQPAPTEKSQAEGDREAVEQEIADEGGSTAPSSATVEQEIAGSD